MAQGLFAQGIMTTVARTDCSFPAGRLTAVEAPLRGVTGLVSDGKGTLWISSTGTSQLLKISAAGAVSVPAGTGDGDLAVNASLCSPSGLPLDAQGNLYTADENNNRVRRVDARTGIITTVAGRAVRGFTGDGRTCDPATLCRPAGVALDAAGRFYISNSWNHRVRRLEPNDLTTIAGNGRDDYSGDNGSATAASIKYAAQIAFDVAGDLCFADYANHRMRRFDRNNIITTFAGNGPFGYNGDGIPAVAASLTFSQVVAASAGGILIGDSLQSRVRLVSASTITTIAGGTLDRLFASGIPAFSTQLGQPRRVTGDALGNLYLSDEGAHLAVSADRITAVLPFGLPVNRAHQLVVRNGSRISVPEQVVCASAQPGVFTQTGTGSGAGAIYRYRLPPGGDPALVSPDARAAVNDTILIQAAGLGEVSPAVADRAAAPADPLAATLAAVIVQIGGKPAEVIFAALIPGLAGIYQIKAIVPEVEPGDEVSVVLEAAGQASPPVSLAAR